MCECKHDCRKAKVTIKPSDITPAVAEAVARQLLLAKRKNGTF